MGLIFFSRGVYCFDGVLYVFVGSGCWMMCMVVVIVLRLRGLVVIGFPNVSVACGRVGLCAGSDVVSCRRVFLLGVSVVGLSIV